MSRLTKEQQYQKDYYEQNKRKRSDQNKWNWKNNPVYREKERKRCALRSAYRRSETAGDRFKNMIAEKRGEMSGTAKPQRAEIDGEVVWVYSTGSLGREIGRSARATRTWLTHPDVSKRALPGASIFVHGVAYFTKEFCEAIYDACRRLYYLDARGTRAKLFGLVMEELATAGVSYVPVGGDNERDRVHPES